MPKLLALPTAQPAIATDARLAIGVDDVARLPNELRGLLRTPQGGWRLRMDAKEYVRVGDEKPEAALEFTCGVLEAAQIIDVVRAKLDGGRAFVNRRGQWRAVPSSVDLTVNVNGVWVLNDEVFGETAVADAPVAPTDEPMWGGDDASEDRGSGDVRAGALPEVWWPAPADGVQAVQEDIDAGVWGGGGDALGGVPGDGRADDAQHGQGGQVEGVGEDHAAQLDADREDAPDGYEYLTFGDGNVVGAEAEAFTDLPPVAGYAPPPATKRPTGKAQRPARTRPLKVLASPVAKTFQQHRDRWQACRDCDLGCQRSQVVFARGQLPCDVLFIGEAPAESEDAMGIPLCGPAGHKLDEVEHLACSRFPQLRRAYVNLVGCFPREAKKAGIHEPDGVEIQACAERLREAISLARPRLVMLLGNLVRRWWPKSVPEHFWAQIGCGTPTVIQVMHPSGILRCKTDMQRQLETQRASSNLLRAFKAVFAAPAVVQ